jgi:dTDP-4-dehydrorhamnose 3,5-epimerase
VEAALVTEEVEMPFEFEPLGIHGIILIKPKVFEDDRGFFMETYRKADFENAGISGEFIQSNHSRSHYGVLRGLHFQREPFAQAKLVRCVRGEIFDVAVDLRKASPTFGAFVIVRLSEANNYQLYIPRYCAHGFLVVSEVADLLYQVDNVYAPEYESGLRWDDPDVNVPWPNKAPILSPKDRQLPLLRDLIEEGVLF